MIGRFSCRLFGWQTCTHAVPRRFQATDLRHRSPATEPRRRPPPGPCCRPTRPLLPFKHHNSWFILTMMRCRSGQRHPWVRSPLSRRCQRSSAGWLSTPEMPIACLRTRPCSLASKHLAQWTSLQPFAFPHRFLAAYAYLVLLGTAAGHLLPPCSQVPAVVTLVGSHTHTPRPVEHTLSNTQCPPGPKYSGYQPRSPRSMLRLGLHLLSIGPEVLDARVVTPARGVAGADDTSYPSVLSTAKQLLGKQVTHVSHPQGSITAQKRTLCPRAEKSRQIRGSVVQRPMDWPRCPPPTFRH